MEGFEQTAAVPVRKNFLNQLVALLFFEMFDIKNCDCFRRKLENSQL